MPQSLPAIGAEVPQAAPSLPPIGAEVVERPSFQTSNEKDAQGNAVVDPNTLGTLLRHLWTGIVSTGQLLPFPKVAGGSGMENPLLPTNIVQSMHAVKREADVQWDKGDKVGASAKYVESVIPLLGPMLSHWGDLAQTGKGMALAGDVAAAIATMKAGGELSQWMKDTYPAATRPPPPGGATLVPPEQRGAIDFGRARGVPIDAATASENVVVKGVQQLADRSLGGSLVATPANRARAAAMTRVAEELSGEAHPVPVTPEQAGTGVQGSIRTLMADLNAQAGTAYDKLRAIEADPQHSSLIANAPMGSRTAQRILGKMAAGADNGQAPSLAELKVMRQMEVELEAQPYTPFLLKPTEKGGGLEHVPGTGGAGTPVYHEILQASGTAGLSRAEVLAGLRKTLETGKWTTASRGALIVAKKQLAASGGLPLSGPLMAPNAPLVGVVERVPLPVDLRMPRRALQPLYDRLKREAELIPLQGDKGRALVALDRLLNGPEVAPVSVVDAALGDLKAMARTDIPELRTQGQGLAAGAVKYLDAAVRQAAAKGGEDAIDALEEGRAATKAKYQAGDVFERLNTEPVRAFTQLTAPKDSGIVFLRQVRDLAPGSMPELARAYLEDLLEKPQKVADWRKLGDETKAILFPKAGQVAALDRFFLLTDHISKTNINPSGSGYHVMLGAQGTMVIYDPLHVIPLQLTGALVSKLLRVPAIVNLLTKGLTMPRVAPEAVQVAATASLIREAKAAGVPLAFPTAAEKRPTP